MVIPDMPEDVIVRKSNADIRRELGHGMGTFSGHQKEYLDPFEPKVKQEIDVNEDDFLPFTIFDLQDLLSG